MNIAAAAPPSQLRGKSIEEIVTRWEQELQSNIKEFNRIAEEVTAWDKVLIENGNYVRDKLFEINNFPNAI